MGSAMDWIRDKIRGMGKKPATAANLKIIKACVVLWMAALVNKEGEGGGRPMVVGGRIGSEGNVLMCWGKVEVLFGNGKVGKWL